MSRETEREAFESDLRSMLAEMRFGDPSIQQSLERQGDLYAETWVNDRWLGWKSRASLAAPLTEEQVSFLRSEYGWAKETIRAIEAAIHGSRDYGNARKE